MGVEFVYDTSVQATGRAGVRMDRWSSLKDTYAEAVHSQASPRKQKLGINTVRIQYGGVHRSYQENRSYEINIGGLVRVEGEKDEALMLD